MVHDFRKMLVNWAQNFVPTSQGRLIVSCELFPCHKITWCNAFAANFRDDCIFFQAICPPFVYQCFMLSSFRYKASGYALGMEHCKYTFSAPINNVHIAFQLGKSPVPSPGYQIINAVLQNLENNFTGAFNTSNSTELPFDPGFYQCGNPTVTWLMIELLCA